MAKRMCSLLYMRLSQLSTINIKALLIISTWITNFSRSMIAPTLKKRNRNCQLKKLRRLLHLLQYFSDPFPKQQIHWPMLDSTNIVPTGKRACTRSQGPKLASQLILLTVNREETWLYAEPEQDQTEFWHPQLRPRHNSFVDIWGIKWLNCAPPVWKIW